MGLIIGEMKLNQKNRESVLYLDKNIEDLKKIKKELGGKIDCNYLILDDNSKISKFGKVICNAESIENGEKILDKLYEKLKKSIDINKIGFGYEFEEGKFICFLKSPRELIYALEYEAMEVLSLFLTSQKEIEKLSNFIAKEVINDVLITDLPTPH